MEHRILSNNMCNMNTSLDKNPSARGVQFRQVLRKIMIFIIVDNYA